MAQEKKAEIAGGTLTLESNKDSNKKKSYYLTYMEATKEENNSFFVSFTNKRDAMHFFEVIERKFTLLERLKEEQAKPQVKK